MCQPNSCCWIPMHNGEHPAYAIQAGVDGNSKLFVIRVHYGNGIIPGKLHVGYKTAYIPYNMKEIEAKQYEVLVAPPETLSWISAQGGNIPPDAIPGGRDPNGEIYFIGRVLHSNTITIGKVHPSHGGCYIPYGGKEHHYANYEILVRNALGKSMNV